MLTDLKQARHNNLIITINSSVIYIFTFLIVYLIYQLITATVATEYRIVTVFFVEKLKFLTQDNNFQLWNRDSAVTVFGAAPIISLVLAFVSIMMYARVSDENYVMKLFFLWIALHFLNRVLGSFIIGTIFFLYGSNLIVDWMYVSMGMKIVLVVSFLILLIIIGAYSVMPILSSAASKVLLKAENRLSFIICQIYIPWLIGSIALFLFFLPKVPLHENLINVTMLIMMTPLYFRYKSPMLPGYEDEEEPVYKYSWIFIVSLIILMLFIKLVFYKGVKFGQKGGNDTDYIWALIGIVFIISGLIYQFIRSFKANRRHVRDLMNESEKIQF